MRVFDTDELLLVALIAALIDLNSSLFAIIAHAYSYVSSAPILALYATRDAVAMRTFVIYVLFTLFVIRLGMRIPPRADRVIRIALFAYIIFVVVANAVLLITLDSLSLIPIIDKIPP